MKIAEVLPLNPNKIWRLASQCGVQYSVGRLPHDHQGNPSVDYMDLLRLKKAHESFGFRLLVIEPDVNWQMHKFKLGLDGAEEELMECKQLIRNMGLLEIPVFCYNFMAHFNWIRTSVNEPGRGGALVTSFDMRDIENAPLTPYGEVTESFLWQRLQKFLEELIPVAEEAKVKLALHPDDPPVTPIQGISRIITSSDALKKAINLVPSPYHGITLCQGTLAAAGEDIPAVIDEFGSMERIFFVHFRDIRGNKNRFVETFHEEGQTDMHKAILKYRRAGFNGPVRIDHAPTMDGEDNLEPGYGATGRVFAIGYLKGLLERSET